MNAEISTKSIGLGLASRLSALIVVFLAVASGCASMNRRPDSLLPERQVLRTGPFRIHTHRAMKHNDPVVAELESLSKTVGNAIGAASYSDSRLVDVYLLKDEESFRHYLKFFHPELPPRRAYFIATDTSRTIYTYMGDHLMEDIRHEATHAIVNLSHPELPLWLDEGLAESFEHPDRSPGADTHRDKFLADIRAGAVPDLARLEGIVDVRDMTPRDYREAWAWVQWGLAGPEPVRVAFREFIDRPPGTANGMSLARMWAGIVPQLNPQGTPMVAWLSQKQTSAETRIVGAPKDTRLNRARLQDDDPMAAGSSDRKVASADKTTPSSKPGFFRRLFGF
jgi:hypothetical protein